MFLQSFHKLNCEKKLKFYHQIARFYEASKMHFLHKLTQSPLLKIKVLIMVKLIQDKPSLKYSVKY